MKTSSGLPLILYYSELYNYFIIYYNEITTEIKCTINVMCLNHPQAISLPPPPGPWKNRLPRNSLVPKTLGTAALEYSRVVLWQLGRGLAHAQLTPPRLSFHLLREVISFLISLPYHSDYGVCLYSCDYLITSCLPHWAASSVRVGDISVRIVFTVCKVTTTAPRT